jgi:hypothetical protein
MGKESYSFAWRKAVVKDPSLSSITKLVLHTLHYYMDNNTGECFPSRETIAEDASLNVRTITPHLTKAQNAGYLIKTKKPTKGKYKRNAYKGIIPHKSIEETHHNLQEYKNKEGEFECPQKGNDIPTNSLNNSSINNSIYNSSEKFNLFWDLYPEGRKQSKKLCHKIWTKNNLDSISDVILNNIRLMKSSTKWKDGFMPSSNRYLEEERWEDGYEKKRELWEGGK